MSESKKVKKGFFAGHAKSSAALVSLIIHAVLVVIAFTFVAVTVITKEDQKFEAKPVNRPKMQLKKLQVPVNVKKKKTQKPKLRKRIVVQPKMNKSMPDIKMPEITGVKGGLGNAAGAGLGGAGGLGFSMPEIEIFGVKGKGEKIFLALDAGADMMHPKMGGIEAYTIIKEELVRIVDELPPTALFNVVVFQHNEDVLAFPNLVPANDQNAAKLKKWLDPLNAVKKGMSDDDYGTHTLGAGGTVNRDSMLVGKFKETKKVGSKSNVEPDVRAWFRSAHLAQKMQADTIFVLTDDWDLQRVNISPAGTSEEEWSKTTAAGKKWVESHKKGLKMLYAENAKRKAAGKPPIILSRNPWAINGHYFPDIERPPKSEWYMYTGKDFAESFLQTRQEYKPKSVQTSSGLGRSRSSKKIDFAFNVIQFVPQDKGATAYSTGEFKKLTSLCKGQYQTIAGLDEIMSYVTEKE